MYFFGRKDFHAKEKLFLLWRGLRRSIKAIKDYVFLVENLQNGLLQEVNISRLRLNYDVSLDKEAIMSHVLRTETGIIVQSLMGLTKTEECIMVNVRWRRSFEYEDTLEPLVQIYEKEPQLLHILLRRKKNLKIW